MERQEILQIIFNLLLVVIICIFIFTTVILVKNINLIKTDPLVIGMEKHNFSSCNCYDNDGLLWISNGQGFYHNSTLINYNRLIDS